MTTYILTEKDQARRRAIAFLKGYIVCYASTHGMKWQSKRTKTAEFETGWKLCEQHGKSYLTLKICMAHIIYNRIRHQKPHTISIENDSLLLDKWRYWKWYVEIVKNLKEISGIGESGLETLYAN